MMVLKNIIIAFFSSLLLCGSSLLADEIRIATASNFSLTLKEVIKLFEQQSDHNVILISGSTGKLYAQIKNGAPFDAFFSADSQRAELLENEEFAIKGSRFTYAMGKIILWSPQHDFIKNNEEILSTGNFRHLAIANPKLAPYGKAAQEVLKNFGLFNTLTTRMVRGENIGQTYQFVKSGNAELGFIALSQVKKPQQSIPGSFWIVPQSLYQPIKQQAVLLKNKKSVRQFLEFIKSQQSLDIIKSFGYAIPDIKTN